MEYSEMEYSEAFENLWTEMCEDHCRGEYDENAKGSAWLMWLIQQETIDHLESKMTNGLKFNITKTEFERAIEFCDEVGHDVISMEVTEGGIGNTIMVQKTQKRGDTKNITNYDAW